MNHCEAEATTSLGRSSSISAVSTVLCHGKIRLTLDPADACTHSAVLPRTMLLASYALLVSALAASVVHGAVDFHYETTMSFNEVLAITVADSQLAVLLDLFKNDKPSKAAVKNAIKSFQASVEDGTFSWEDFTQKLSTFTKSLSTDTLAAENALHQHSAYSPVDWRGELATYQWDALNYLIEHVYDEWVAAGKVTEALEAALSTRESIISNEGVAKGMALNGAELFTAAIKAADELFAASLTDTADAVVQDLVTMNTYPTWASTNPRNSSKSAPTAAASIKPASPVPSMTGTASLATISMAVAGVALSVAALFS